MFQVDSRACALCSATSIRAVYLKLRIDILPAIVGQWPQE